MTSFERKAAGVGKLDLAEALEAIRLIEAQEEEIARVDLRVNPTLAYARLEHLGRRRSELRKTVKRLVG